MREQDDGKSYITQDQVHAAIGYTPLTVYVMGPKIAINEISKMILEDVEHAELSTLPIVLLFVILTFGGKFFFTFNYTFFFFFCFFFFYIKNSCCDMLKSDQYPTK
jgi:hypothetical protein